jgi:hypothetical protein
MCLLYPPTPAPDVAEIGFALEVEIMLNLPLGMYKSRYSDKLSLLDEFIM